MTRKDHGKPSRFDLPSFGNFEKDFRDQGFCVIPGVLTPAQVREARNISASLLNEGEKTNELACSDLLANEFLSSLPFSTLVIRTLKQLLGEQYVTYPSFVLRKNRFTSWHIDNGFNPRFLDGDSSYLWSPEFMHCQCVIYFQDNDPELGGGLDVVPGTHKYEVEYDNFKISEDTLKSKTKDSISLATKAGDLIVFDGRLLHRGTPALKETREAKLGLFWSSATNFEAQNKGFLTYLSGRADFLRSINLNPPEFMIRRYDDVTNVSFPSGFTPGVVALLEREGLLIKTVKDNLKNPIKASLSVVD